MLDIFSKKKSYEVGQEKSETIIYIPTDRNRIILNPVERTLHTSLKQASLDATSA
jgi:hypothetical protein